MTIEDVRYVSLVRAIVLARTVEREYLDEIRELEEQLAEIQSKWEQEIT